jgi:Outer membrane protein
MNYMALKMLLGDRAKYLSLIFTVAFASFLLANQVSIFCGIMLRTASQIVDVPDADLWVMDRETQYVEETKALTDNALYRVRGVRGIRWAVPLYKGLARATAPDGKFRQVILLGLDDATLVGAPRQMLKGRFEDLKHPEAVIIDRAVELAYDRYRSGLVDFLDVLEAERSLFTTQAQLAQSEQVVSHNLVRLHKALGGGWDPPKGPIDDGRTMSL